jgi:hypothetical protein
MKEYELYSPIFELFPNHDFYPEVAAGERSRTTKTIDLIGMPIDGTSIDLISIEVKIRDWRKVLKQASDNRFYVDLSFAALPESQIPQLDLSMFKSRGVGVISVNGVAEEVVPACRSAYVRSSKRDFIIRTCQMRRMEVRYA